MNNFDGMRDQYIDTHTHYTHPRFDCGREEILKGLSNTNVLAVVEVAIQYELNDKILKLCKKYPFVFAAIGCHPNCISSMDQEKFEIINKIVRDEPKVLAIGEVGLDFSKNRICEEIKAQKECFIRFIESALSTRKPLIIHCRGAYEDLINILSCYKFPSKAGIIHSFSGNVEQARQLIDMGFLIGVGGLFTKSPDEYPVREALRKIPISKIVFETDAPFLMPKGMEGKRNSSVNLHYIASELSKLRDEDVRIISEYAIRNSLDLFPQIVNLLTSHM